jgi:hypothetical protein
MMHEVLAEWQPGKLIFPQVVRRLLEAGVKSYFCDLEKRQETFDARRQDSRGQNDPSAVGRRGSSSGLIAAIRGA